jgi:Domain of unknown function (DUF4160)
MPTVLRLGALRVAIYPNDHRPAHVHVIGQGHEAVFVMNRPAGGVTLRENYGFPQRSLIAIERGLSRTSVCC